MTAAESSQPLKRQRTLAPSTSSMLSLTPNLQRRILGHMAENSNTLRSFELATRPRLSSASARPHTSLQSRMEWASLGKAAGNIRVKNMTDAIAAAISARTISDPAQLRMLGFRRMQHGDGYTQRFGTNRVTVWARANYSGARITIGEHEHDYKLEVTFYTNHNRPPTILVDREAHGAPYQRIEVVNRHQLERLRATPYLGGDRAADDAELAYDILHSFGQVPALA